jgi:hypothetical protein
LRKPVFISDEAFPAGKELIVVYNPQNGNVFYIDELEPDHFKAFVAGLVFLLASIILLTLSIIYRHDILEYNGDTLFRS